MSNYSFKTIFWHRVPLKNRDSGLSNNAGPSFILYFNGAINQITKNKLTCSDTVVFGALGIWAPRQLPTLPKFVFFASHWVSYGYCLGKYHKITSCISLVCPPFSLWSFTVSLIIMCHTHAYNPSNETQLCPLLFAPSVLSAAMLRSLFPSFSSSSQSCHTEARGPLTPWLSSCAAVLLA